MRYFKTSLLLALAVVVLFLSEPGKINGSVRQEPEKNVTSLGSTNKEQKTKPENLTTQTQHAQPPPSEQTPPKGPIHRDTTQTQSGPPPPSDPLPPIAKPPSPIRPPEAQIELNWGSVPDWGLLAIAIITACLALRSLKTIRIQADASTDAANAALATANSLITSERAYVKMSHVPPGLIFQENQTVNWCEVTVKVENGGRTPAKVTDVRLTAWVRAWEDPLPPIPDIREQAVDSAPNGFLLPGDYFYVTRTFPLGKKGSPNPRTGDVRLCIFGLIDYIDAFEKRHRAGYARQFEDERENNLFFVDRPGYNYDRHRQPGEGNDWN